MISPWHQSINHYSPATPIELLSHACPVLMKAAGLDEFKMDKLQATNPSFKPIESTSVEEMLG